MRGKNEENEKVGSGERKRWKNGRLKKMRNGEWRGDGMGRKRE